MYASRCDEVRQSEMMDSAKFGRSSNERNVNIVLLSSVCGRRT